MQDFTHAWIIVGQPGSGRSALAARCAALSYPKGRLLVCDGNDGTSPAEADVITTDSDSLLDLVASMPDRRFLVVSLRASAASRARRLGTTIDEDASIFDLFAESSWLDHLPERVDGVYACNNSDDDPETLDHEARFMWQTLVTLATMDASDKRWHIIDWAATSDSPRGRILSGIYNDDGMFARFMREAMAQLACSADTSFVFE